MTESPIDNKRAEIKNPVLRTMRFKVVPITTYILTKFIKIFGELTTIVLGVAFLWFYGLNTVLAQQEFKAGFLTHNAKLWFDQAFEGRVGNIGDIRLKWSPTNNVLEILTDNIAIESDDGRRLQELNQASLGLSVKSLMAGRFDPKHVELTGASLTWQRKERGLSSLNLGSPDAADGLVTILQFDLNDYKNDQSDVNMPDYLSLRDGIIYINDPAVKDGTRFENANISLNRLVDTQELISEFNADWVSGETIAPLSVTSQFNPNSQKMISNGSLTSFVPTHFLLEDYDALKTANSSISWEAIRDTENTRVDLSLEAIDGVIKYGLKDIPFKTLKSALDFNFLDKTINIVKTEITSDTLSGQVSGQIIQTNSFANPSLSPTRFDLNVADFFWDRTDIFDKPFALKTASLKGSFDPKNNRLDLENIRAKTESYDVDSRLLVVLDDKNNPTSFDGGGIISGELDQRDVLDLWPTEFASGARRWIEKAIIAGQIYNFTFDVRIPESALENKVLENDHLKMSFAVKDANVRFIQTMSTLENVTGKGVLSGNRFDFDVTSGEIDGLTLHKGRVEIPRLNPKGGDFTISGDGSGPVLNMMRLIDQEPFRFPTRYGLNPDEFAGMGNIQLKVTRPLLEFFERDRIRYDVVGEFSDIVAPLGFADNTIMDGSVLLTADSHAIAMKGPVKIGPWQADMSWREPLGDPDEPTEYSLEGVVDRDVLNGFGIGLREFIGGQTRLSIKAQGDGLNVTGAKLEGDLTDTELSLGQFWSKPIGQDGRFSARIDKGIKGQISIQDVDLQANGLDLKAHADLNDSFGLISTTIDNIKLEGLLDAQLTVSPSTDKEQIDIVMTGNYMDISSFVENGLNGAGSGIALPIKIRSDLETLVIKEDYVLKDAQLYYDSKGVGIDGLRLLGQHNNSPMMLSINKDTSGVRDVSAEIPNASAVLSSFLELRATRGGTLSFSGSLPVVGQTGPMTGTVEFNDFKLVQAPVFAQILSLASLRGLTDLLGGEGVYFDKVEVPLSYENGKFSVDDAIASGSALGMTGRGKVDFSKETVDFKGVLVPAYTANSALGSIPVIGDIFVGKKGEGIFAINYSVVGPFSQTQISVNPFSALTPGFLRQIFDTNDDTDETEAVSDKATQDE